MQLLGLTQECCKPVAGRVDIQTMPDNPTPQFLAKDFRRLGATITCKQFSTWTSTMHVLLFLKIARPPTASGPCVPVCSRFSSMARLHHRSSAASSDRFQCSISDAPYPLYASLAAQYFSNSRQFLSCTIATSR